MADVPLQVKITDILELPTAETDDELVLAPDGAGGVEFRAEGVGGSGGPVELDYVQITSNVSPSATTEATANTVVTANAVAFDGSTIVLIEFFAPIARGGSPSGDLSLWLYDGSSSIGRIGFKSAADNCPIWVVRRVTPSNASHTYSIRASVSANTGLIQAGAGGTATTLPAYIRIVTVEV